MHPKGWKKTFATLWTGQFISLISSSAVNFALIIWLSLETGSAEVLAYAAIAGLLPQALIGPFAGVFIDRWDRLTTMIGADTFIALCTLGISLLFLYGGWEIHHIYLLLGLRSMGSAFHMPALQAFIPSIAPKNELLRLAGLNQIIQSVSAIAGPALGALALGLMDIAYVLWLDIAGALLAIFSLLLIRIPSAKKSVSIRQAGTEAGSEEREHPFRKALSELVSAIQLISRNKGLSYLFLTSTVAMFCIMPVAVMFPLLTIQHFGGGKFEISVIEIIWGLGMLIGGGLLSLFKPGMNRATLINWMHITLGACLALSGIISQHAFLIFAALTAIGGVAASIYNATFTSLVQIKVDSAFLGRVFSMYFSLALLPSMVGLVATGFIADQVGIRLAFFILGTGIAVVGIFSFLIKPLMDLGKVVSPVIGPDQQEPEKFDAKVDL